MTSGVRTGDPATCVDAPAEEPRIGIESLRRLYGEALAGLRRREPPSHAGYRLCWAATGVSGQADLLAQGGSYVVIGRHRRCDVRLRDDPELSLRHLVARAETVDGSVRLRLIDLQASLPFYLLDDAPHRSAIASGPVALRLGRYAVVALPIEEAALDRLPGELPEPTVVDEPASELRPVDEEVSHSHITSLPGISQLVDQRVPQAELGDACVEVEGEEQSATVCLRSHELERGVLVGRADRCFDGGIRAMLNGQISRAHLLIMRDGDRVRVYDLCSTNGTTLDGRRLGSGTLQDAGACLQLSRGRGVLLHWRRRTI